MSSRKLTGQGDNYDSELLAQIWSRLLSEHWRADPTAEYRIKIKFPSRVREKREATKFKLFIAGGLAGGVAKTVGAPLSRATIMMQTQAALGQQNKGFVHITSSIFKKEGFRGLCKGNGIDVLRSVPMTGLSFLTYGSATKVLEERSPFTRKDHRIIQAMLAGSTAAMTAITLTYPLDLLRAKVIVSEEKTTLVKMMRQVLAKEGFRGLFQGWPAAMMASVPKLSISFTVNESVTVCFGSE